MRNSAARRNNRKIWIAGAAASGLIGFALPQASPAATILSGDTISQQGDKALSHYTFAQDSVLGTSLDLTVCAPHRADAAECERQIMQEIERLRGILSTYDPTSEIERYKAGGHIESPELAELLNAYALWQARSGGAINVNMAEVISLWKRAAVQKSVPTADALYNAAIAELALNVDALGKGYIIDRAVKVAQRYAPAGLLNIGGDIRAWGNVDWTIGVADPRNFSENALPLAQLVLRNAAVATSGGYARFFDIGERRFSHIIDPRNGWPVEQILSATVVADDCMTANAIATAATVLDGAAGNDLAARFGSAHLLLDDSNQVWQGGAIALADSSTPTAGTATPSSKPSSDNATAWPKDFQVTININVKPNTGVSGAPQPRGGEQGPRRDGPQMRGPGGRRGGGGGAKRPYIAVWIQDANQKVIRTISLFGDNPRWMPELSYWFQAASGNTRNVQSITRATRPAGRFALTWDGKDDSGKQVSTGEYTVVIELNREHGRHVKETIAVNCDQTAKSLKVNETAESDPSTIEYGPITASAENSGGQRSDAN